MNIIMLLIHALVLAFAAYKDIKHREVENYISATLFIVALIRAIYLGYEFTYIVFWSLLTPSLLFMQELLFQLKKKNKSDESIGIGGADIKIHASIGLILGSLSPIHLMISFILSLIIGGLVLKQKSFPLVPYFLGSLICIYIYGAYN